MRIAWMFILAASTGWAQGALQNMDWSWMVGGTSNPSSTISGTNDVISASAGVATQINWAYQLKSTKAGNLWIELPLTLTAGAFPSVSGATIAASIDRNTVFLTPGLRLKSPTYGRVSFYGSLGGGFGAVTRVEALINLPNGTVIADTRVRGTLALDFGGGIDLRLSRLISLRAEGRDFVTPDNFSGVSGPNHPVFLAGLAFHF
jgi:hypothetical protein